MSAPGFWEIAALAVLALIIFGPDKLPGIAHTAGKTLARFKREASATLDELKAAAELEDMRGVADDFKGIATDLKQSASLSTGPAATAAAVGADHRATAASPPEGPPPFDPDAT